MRRLLLRGHRALRRIVPFVFSAALIGIFSTGCGGDAGTDPAPQKPVVVTRVAISPDSALLTIGQTQAFSATGFSASGAQVPGRTVKWSTQDGSIATIGDNGIAAAVRAGITQVVASIDGVSASVQLRAKEPPPARVAITPDSAVIAVGQTQTFSAKALNAAGEELTGRTVTWSSSNAAVAAVDSGGNATGATVGTAMITATVEGVSASVQLRVKEPPPARVVITPDSAVVAIGQTQSFSAKTLNAAGEELAGRVVTWSSSNAAVATVDSGGNATGVTVGTATLTATVEGVSASVRLRVKEPSPARVTITPDSAALIIGQTQAFSAKAFDAAGAELTGRAVVWSSSDAGVFTVGETGLVRARSAGSATVTATVDGVVAAAPVRVRVNPVAGTSYANFKNVGLQPSSIPLPRTQRWGFHELARGYGDFFGRGTLDMFTSTVDYDLNDSPAAAQRAVYRFWRKDGDTYVEDNSIMVSSIPPCLHSRKALVADFNLDARPDIFIVCHGYDAAPFPMEPNQILLSQSNGKYLLREASPDLGFWHGAAAADLNGDHYPDVVLVAGGQRAVFINDGTGAFTREAINRLPGDPVWGFGGSNYFTVELVDVNEDGKVDLVMGGHEWDEGYGTTPTGIWLNPGDNVFSGVNPVVIPAVANEGVVVDFALTGTGASRAIWVSRTSGGDGTFYQSAVLQRFNWSTRDASVVFNQRPAHWVPWIVPYMRGGTLYVGSDDLRTPMEAVVQ